MRGKEQLMVGLVQTQAFIREVLMGKEPKFSFSQEAKEALRELVMRDNPRGSEAWFLASGRGFLVERVYTQEQFSEGSRFRRVKKDVFESSVGFEEYRALLGQIRSQGHSQEIVPFLGHLHPTGIFNIGGENIDSTADESCLLPSKGDMECWGSLIKEGPPFYHAIAANTGKGPFVRIYSLRPLLIRPHCKRLPYATIELDS